MTLHDKINEQVELASLGYVGHTTATDRILALVKAHGRNPMTKAEYPAVEHLRHNQRQLDADGTQVGVSRQALDETLARIAELEAENAALSAPSRDIPEGWRLVPEKPTDKMLKAAFVAMNQTPAGEWKAMKAANLSPRAISDAKMAPRYRAMISAAPPAPESGQ